MERYFVIATHWDDEKKAPMKFVAGEFTSWINAALFRDAYNEHYKADAHVVLESALLNK